MFKKYITGEKSSNLIICKRQHSNKMTTTPNMNTSFESLEMEVPERRTKLVKTKASAVLAVNERPFKQFKLRLELDKDEDQEVYGTISFDVTPMRTPICRCPNAPRATKAKLILRLRHIRQLVFSSDEEEE